MTNWKFDETHDYNQYVGNNIKIKYIDSYSKNEPQLEGKLISITRSSGKGTPSSVIIQCQKWKQTIGTNIIDSMYIEIPGFNTNDKLIKNIITSNTNEDICMYTGNFVGHFIKI